MSIIFRNTPGSEPFTFDSLGNGWQQDRVIRPGGYPYYHYIQTETGAGKIEIDGRHYILKEQEGMLIAPFVRHSYEKTTDEWYTLFATFTGTVENALPQMLGNRRFILTGSDQGKRIADLVSDCLDIYSASPVDEASLSVECYRLLVYFTERSSAEQTAEDPLYQRYVDPVIREIEINYSLALTVEELSRMVFITPQYLSRLFRRFLGCSTYEYLTSCRIGKAKQLLITNPRLEIQDIARKTGFSDASHFIAVFKKMTGFTPMEFRRMN